ncbi:transglutaminase domain-containing protein [bacterium]|nr:transglutaminase domain-containing protein [bacterium]
MAALLNRSIIDSLACLAIVLTSLGPAFASGGIPPVSDDELAQALALAGGNRPQLEAALEWAAADDYHQQAMRFVVVSLPLADLGAITAELLVEHVELATRVRRELPFAREYSDADWAHYVLPPRVSQEPLQPWRSYFYGELKDLVAEAGSLTEAAVLVQGWVWERIRFEQTQRRDQGPLTTLKGGYGRCEELMMVEICALRSIGVPARNAFCPWWAHCDNNHAWTEIMVDGGVWMNAGCVSLDPEPKENWEVKACRGAPIVCTMCFGLPEELGPDVVGYEDQVGARYARINSITSYRTGGRLVVDLYEAAAEPDPAEPWSVYVHVYNYGALRPIAKIPVDAELLAEVVLGAGTYVLSTDAPVANPVVAAEVFDGADSLLIWVAAEPLPADLVLEFPQEPAPGE